MTSNESDHQVDHQEALGDRIQSLERMVTGWEFLNRKKQKIYLFSGIALILVCNLCLLSLTRNAFQLDAQTLTQIGRAEVERQLPVEMENLRLYLKEQAPQVISHLLRASLNMFPKLRFAIVQDVNEKTLNMTEDFEGYYVGTMKAVIEETKRNIDQLNSNKTDLEKFEMLVTHTIDEFRGVSSAMFRELYPHYASEMERIKSFLVDLQHKEDSQLGERERIQKELIQTLLRLMSYEELKTE